MKKIFIILLLMFMFVFFNQNIVFWLDFFSNESNYTTNLLDAVWLAPDNNLRQWMYNVAQFTDNIMNDWISSSGEARNDTMTLIRNITNFLLWILSFIVLVYVLYCWVIALTAWSNDEQYKKWLNWIKFSFLALWWIWFSWLIVSFILYLINFQ